MTADITYFVLSLFACSVGLLTLQVQWMRGVKPTFLTIPGLIFCWVYFIVVPAFNVIFNLYVDEIVFIERPITSLTRLNIANAGLLFLAAFSARLVSAGAPTIAKEIRFDAVIPALTLLLIVQILWGIYTIFLSGELLTAQQDTELRASLFRYAVIESAPLTFAWTTALHYARAGRRPGPAFATLLILVTIVLIVALSSSRGSRVAMVSQLIFCAMIFHYTIFKFRFRHFLAGAVATGLFLPIYANYKYSGIEGLRQYLSGQGMSREAQLYNNPVGFVIGDIGRADIQAPLLSRYLDGVLVPNGIGETYLGAVSLFLPSDLRPDWLRPKRTVGAEAQLGAWAGSQGYRGVVNIDGVFESSRIYGLFGEALINFGITGLLAAFFVFGYVIRWAYLALNNIASWRELLTAPYLAFIPIFLLFYDLDNIIVQTVSVWVVPFLVLNVAHRFAPRSRRVELMAR